LLRRGERRLDQILAGLVMLRRALRVPEVEIRDDEVRIGEIEFRNRRLYSLHGYGPGTRPRAHLFEREHMLAASTYSDATCAFLPRSSTTSVGV